MKILSFILLLITHSDWEVGDQLSPVQLKENIQLKDYETSKFFRLNEKEYLLIGKDEVFNVENEGFRLIYLFRDETTGRFPIRFISNNKGEAYVYNPYIFAFNDGTRLLIAEEGYEYMSGIDIFRFERGEISFIGHLSVSGPLRDSVIGNMIVEKKEKDFRLRFSGQIEYEVATDNIIKGERLSCLISNGKMKINLK
ncbi:MAG: hypothetical protein R8G66_22905 [Cytophagales bacterium]|nr:hypothetical protein [Cytophagales bacterium]